MLYLLLAAAAIICAYQMVRAQRLLISTLWLALTSALTAILMYMLGAPEVAVIELSVGAGLVTVLFVFAFSIVGEQTWDELTMVPRPLVIGMVLAAVFLLGWFILPLTGLQVTGFQVPFGQMLWGQRGLDVLAQIVLIFAGVLGLIGLLAEARKPLAAPAQPAAEPHPELPAAEPQQMVLEGSMRDAGQPEELPAPDKEKLPA